MPSNARGDAQDDVQDDQFTDINNNEASHSGWLPNNRQAWIHARIASSHACSRCAARIPSSPVISHALRWPLRPLRDPWIARMRQKTDLDFSRMPPAADGT
jgi:hypothetical protein